LLPLGNAQCWLFILNNILFNFVIIRKFSGELLQQILVVLENDSKLEKRENTFKRFNRNISEKWFWQKMVLCSLKGQHTYLTMKITGCLSLIFFVRFDTHQERLIKMLIIFESFLFESNKHINITTTGINNDIIW